MHTIIGAHDHAIVVIAQPSRQRVLRPRLHYAYGLDKCSWSDWLLLGSAPLSSDGLLMAKSLPRYAMVADSIVQDIRRGKFKVGELIPTESEISEQFGVSRHTVREAVGRLVHLGIVSRRAGVGTTVLSASPRRTYRASISDITELFEYARETSLQVIDEQFVNVKSAPELVAANASDIGQWLLITSLRRPAAGGQPISFTEMFVHPSYERVRERIRDRGVIVYKLIESMFGERIVEVAQEIAGTAVTAKAAELLEARKGAPALHVIRYYLGDANRLLAMSINIYPADRFRLRTRWRSHESES